MAVDQSTLRALQVYNGLAPMELPKAVYIPLDFRTLNAFNLASDIEIDLELFEQEAHLSWVQAIFIDNSKSGQNFSITANTTQHTLSLRSGQQAFLPFLVSGKSKMMASTGGQQTADLIKVQLLNVPVPAIVW